MVTVQCWTGAQTRALRQAMRLTIRAFAERLGVDTRTITKWEARGHTITLLPDTQALMDTALSRAPDDVKIRVTQAVDSAGQKPAAASPSKSLKTSHTIAQWSHHSITLVAQQITGEDLSTTRRDTLAAGPSAALAGAALTEPLQHWLLPINQDVEVATSESGFSPTELASLEELVGQFRDWAKNGHGMLVRKAVVAQLNDVTDRLREVSPGPATWPVFRVAAELAEVVASILWAHSLHRSAQRYYVLSVQLAKLANDDGHAAIVLADLARQCYGLGHPQEGLEIVALAQYGSRKTATARLRSMLATREAGGYALLGESQAVHRAVGRAEEYFADGPSDDDHRRFQHLDAAGFAALIGEHYRELARHEPRWAGKAHEYLQEALRHPSEEPRFHAQDLIVVARTHLISAEPEHACELVHQAIPLAQPWANGIVGIKLGKFHQEAARYADIPVVGDTRDLIHELTSANRWWVQG
ncbi:MAG: helix-turn-helix transcriptional regulator [Pseudonocardiales bacterium]|nr:helix-turn-helix transcriptional regulator [Pseudonocardiales bacterium]